MRPSILSTIGQIMETALKLVACGVLMAMMLLTAFDVFFRNVLGSPLRGAFELTELLLAVLIFAGLPLVVRAGQHITVDILALPFRGLADRIVAVLTEAIGGLLLIGVAYLLWNRAIRFSAYGDHTSQLHIPIGPFIYTIAALTAIAGLIHLVLAASRLVERRQS